MSNASSNQACAACKFQRRRCSADCPLARYFPAEQNQRFMSCKRLFGVSNMIRFLKDADPLEKDDTMKSLIYESGARQRDPIHGCLGIVNRLKDQVEKLTEELHATRQQLHMLEQQHTATLYQQHLVQSLANVNVPAAHASTSTHNINIPPHMHMQHMMQMMPQQYAAAAAMNNIDEGLELYDTRPSATYDQRQEDYINLSRQTYEPRFNDDLTLNVEHMVNQMPEQELKSAAALFSLTSTHH